VLDKRGQADFRFSTYQVNRGAERLFEQAGFEDGDSEYEATFYALLPMRYFSTGISIPTRGLMELRFRRSQIKF